MQSDRLVLHRVGEHDSSYHEESRQSNMDLSEQDLSSLKKESNQRDSNVFSVDNSEKASHSEASDRGNDKKSPQQDQSNDVKMGMTPSMSDIEKNSEGSGQTGESILSSIELQHLANDLLSAQLLNEIDPSSLPDFLTASISARALARSRGSLSPSSPSVSGDLASLEKILSEKLGKKVPTLTGIKTDSKDSPQKSAETPCSHLVEDQLQKEKSLFRLDSFSVSDYFRDTPENSPRYQFSPLAFQSKDSPILLSDSEGGMQSASPSEFILSPSTPSSHKGFQTMHHPGMENPIMHIPKPMHGYGDFKSHAGFQGDTHYPIQGQDVSNQCMQNNNMPYYYAALGGFHAINHPMMSPLSIEIGNLYSPRSMDVSGHPSPATPPLGKVLSRVRTPGESSNSPLSNSVNFSPNASVEQAFAKMKSEERAKSSPSPGGQQGGKGRSRRKSAFGGTPETNKAWQAVTRARQRSEMNDAANTMNYSNNITKGNSNTKRHRSEIEEGTISMSPHSISTPSMPLPGVGKAIPAMPLSGSAFSSVVHVKDVNFPPMENESIEMMNSIRSRNVESNEVNSDMDASSPKARDSNSMMSAESSGLNSISNLNEPHFSQTSIMETMKIAYTQMQTFHNSLAAVEGSLELMSSSERAKRGVNDAQLLASRMRREKRHQRMVEMYDLVPRLNVAGIHSLLHEAYGYIATMQRDLQALAKLNEASAEGEAFSLMK